MNRTVVLADENGSPIGIEDVLKAHEHGGRLHLAFSSFVFRNEMEELLLQQRSATKPLFAEYWANTCCSHPYEGENIVAAGERRLREECGFSCDLEVAGSFVYKADDKKTGLTEYEHDTVLRGTVDTVELKPDPEEIAKMKWMNVEELQRDIETNPDAYAPWFPPALAIALQHD